MKLSGLSILAAVAGITLAAAPLAAQRHVEVRRTVVTERHDGPRMDRWHGRHHKTCRTSWVHHRKVTRCW